MSDTKKQFPRPVQLISADNGYVLLIGCSLFVCEGSPEDLTKDLQKYLECSEEVVRDYLYTGIGAFLEEEAAAEPAAEEVSKVGYKFPSPAFEYLNSNSNTLGYKVKEVWKATNGTITLDFRHYTAIVKQGDLAY